MDRDIFVENVKKLCAIKGIGPTKACKESGVGGSFISDIKRGRVPSVANVQMLADYLGVTTSELLGEKKDGSGAVSDVEAALDREIISRLVQLTPEELEKVDAFVQGLLASH